jgi:hypothetical protein
MTELTDLAVRAARAELERDQAIARAEAAERQAQLANNFVADPVKFAETMTLVGIPVADIKDIYRILNEWRKQGGRPKLLDLYRDLERLRRDEAIRNGTSA